MGFFITQDRRDGAWIEGHGNEFPPPGTMLQPHEGALFNRLDLGTVYRYTDGAWVATGGGPGASITVQETDGTPSVAAVDTIQFHEADGFVLTDLGAGDVRVDLAAVPEAQLSLNFATHDNANDPSAGEKAALAGTSGVPGAGNKYVTDADARNTNSRTPTAHEVQSSGGFHTAAGLTIGHVMRASGAAAFSFAAIQDADLPSTIARDSEVTTAITTHEAAADPHTGYQRESEKGAASGYASLDAGTLVPVAQLPAGTTAAKGVVELATDGESAANVVVQGNDARMSNARTPTVHSIIGAEHNGFPGGTTTFLRADASFAAPTASVALSSADIAFTDGDTMRRVTVTDGGILATSKITGSIRRPDVEDTDDRGYIYVHNIVKVAVGSFDMLVAALGWGFDDPTEIPPNETVKFYYTAS